MKKYFLIVALLTVVFLGLGNSYASASCEDVKQANSTLLRTGHTFTCELDSTDNDICPTGKQTCLGQGNSCMNTLYACCICDKPPETTPNPEVCTEENQEDCQDAPTPTTTTTTTSNTTPTAGTAGTACDSIITGGKINQRGKCACPTGTKRVKNKCELCTKKGVCCGISLNTSVPFIGKCIEDTTGSVSPDETGVTGDQAFPVLMGSLTKILVTVILILSFVLIVIGGIMIATGNPSGGKKMIIRVVIGIALLGASGVILRLINPNFFG